MDPEETGELLVRGVRGLSMFAEYLNRPDATAESFDDDGWFATGDLVTPHPDGHLSFDSRAKDMLKVGAENVSAAEIERVIAAVPGGVEVGVVGRPDPKLDEAPVAFVQVVDGASAELDRIEADCARLLADFKRPRAVAAADDTARSDAERRWVEAAHRDPSGDAI